MDATDPTGNSPDNADDTSRSSGHGHSRPDAAVHLGYVRWPPPGLDRVQGDLWKVTRELFVGGFVLVPGSCAGMLETVAQSGMLR